MARCKFPSKPVYVKFYKKNWRRRYNKSFGRAHFGLFTIKKKLKEELSKVEADIGAIIRGVPRPRPTNLQQQRLQTVLYNKVVVVKILLEHLRSK